MRRLGVGTSAEAEASGDCADAEPPYAGIGAGPRFRVKWECSEAESAAVLAMPETVDG